MNRRALARKAAGAQVPLPPPVEQDQGGVAHVSQKLQDSLAREDYYAALQMYKTLVMRCLKGDHLDVTIEQQQKAIDLALDASLTLISHKQLKPATEMAILMIGVYDDFKHPVDEPHKENLRKITTAFNQVKGSAKDLTEVLNKAVKWSSIYGTRKRGDPELQLLLARAFEANADYTHAAKHYLHAEQPLEFTQLLLKWSKQGHSSECDLYLARAVLQLLCLENLRDANIVYEHYLEGAKKEKQEIDTPLVHFIRYLLLTLERDALPLFQLLQEKYATVLSRDEAFSNYLSVIGQKFYNLQPPRNPLSSLMEMFTGGM